MVQPTLGDWLKALFTTSWFYAKTHLILLYKTSSCTYNVFKPLKNTGRNKPASFTFYASTTELPSNVKPAIVNRNDLFRLKLESTINISPRIEISKETQYHTDIFMKQITFTENIQPLIDQIKKATQL